MKAELSKKQIESIILSTETAIQQLERAKLNHEELVSDFNRDITRIKELRNKISLISSDDFTAFTKYEAYLFINIASHYKELHQKYQDKIISEISKVQLDILQVFKNPLPYIDVIYIRKSKD